MNKKLEKKGGSHRAAFFTARDRSRMVELDILRAAAILLVLFTHADDVQTGRPGVLNPVITYLQLLGPTGVDLFFVLSGFLVGGLLIKEFREKGELDVRRFLVRRGFRIWPAYFVFIAFLFVRITFRDGEPASATFNSLIPNLLHLQNYLGSPRNHTWSLAVEEHFYLVLPILLLTLTHRRVRSSISLSLIPAITVAVCIACAVARYYSYQTVPSYTRRFATHLRLDSLLFGVMIAYLYHFRPETLAFARNHRKKILTASVALLLIVPAFVHVARRELAGTFGFIMLYVAYGAILVVMVQPGLDSDRKAPTPASRARHVLAFIGYFSYPIYLWHIDAGRPVGRFVPAFMTSFGTEAGWLVTLLAYVAFTVAAGVLMGAIVDRPMLALRDRLFPARTVLPTARDAGPADTNGAVIA